MFHTLQSGSKIVTKINFRTVFHKALLCEVAKRMGSRLDAASTLHEVSEETAYKRIITSFSRKRTWCGEVSGLGAATETFSRNSTFWDQFFRHGWTWLQVEMLRGSRNAQWKPKRPSLCWNLNFSFFRRLQVSGLELWFATVWGLVTTSLFQFIICTFPNEVVEKQRILDYI